MPITKRRRRYWPLMVRKRYVWFINRKRSKKKNKIKYKTKQGKGFSDPFKFIYSLGSQWRNSMR